MKRLAFLLLVLGSIFALSASAAPLQKPYNPKADAKAEVQAAMLAARADHKPVLIFFGANWCPDCRALAKSLSGGKNAALMRQHFNIVKVDVGNFDRNLDVAEHYGDPIKKGIPAAVIVSPEGKVLYATRAGELANARTMSDAGVYAFFAQTLKKIDVTH
jgi:protein disulfide-isomerase